MGQIPRDHRDPEQLFFRNDRDLREKHQNRKRFPRRLMVGGNKVGAFRAACVFAAHVAQADYILQQNQSAARPERVAARIGRCGAPRTQKAGIPRANNAVQKPKKTSKRYDRNRTFPQAWSLTDFKPRSYSRSGGPKGCPAIAQVFQSRSSVVSDHIQLDGAAAWHVANWIW